MKAASPAVPAPRGRQTSNAPRIIQVGDDLTIHETRRIAAASRDDVLCAVKIGVLRSHYVSGRKRIAWRDAMRFRNWYWHGGRAALRGNAQ
jgi:hypothetical protein